MKDRAKNKGFLELLPKAKLMAGLSLLVLLIAVLYAQRRLPATMEQLKAVFAPPATSRPAPTEPRVRLAPSPPPTEKTP